MQYKAKKNKSYAQRLFGLLRGRGREDQLLSDITITQNGLFTESLMEYLQSIRSIYIQSHCINTVTKTRRTTLLRVNWWFLAEEAANLKKKDNVRKLDTKLQRLLFSSLFCCLHMHAIYIVHLITS